MTLIDYLFFFFNDTATTEIYTRKDTLSLHDALPISCYSSCGSGRARSSCFGPPPRHTLGREPEDRLQWPGVRQRRRDAARRPQGVRSGARDAQEIRWRGDPVGAAARHGSQRNAHQGHVPRDRRQRKKYDSVDAMPPDVRRTYEQAMARVASGGAAVKPPVAPVV